MISDIHFWFQDAVKSNEERIKLESQIEELQKKLSEEATAKKQITLLLLEDRKKMATLYLEEKKRSEDLNHLLREEKSKVKYFDTNGFKSSRDVTNDETITADYLINLLKFRCIPWELDWKKKVKDLWQWRLS